MTNEEFNELKSLFSEKYAAERNISTLKEFQKRNFEFTLRCDGESFPIFTDLQEFVSGMVLLSYEKYLVKIEDEINLFKKDQK